MLGEKCKLKGMDVKSMKLQLFHTTGLRHMSSAKSMELNGQNLSSCSRDEFEWCETCIGNPTGCEVLLFIFSYTAMFFSVVKYSYLTADCTLYPLVAVDRISLPSC